MLQFDYRHIHSPSHLEPINQLFKQFTPESLGKPFKMMLNNRETMVVVCVPCDQAITWALTDGRWIWGLSTQVWMMCLDEKATMIVSGYSLCLLPAMSGLPLMSLSAWSSTDCRNFLTTALVNRRTWGDPSKERTTKDRRQKSADVRAQT